MARLSEWDPRRGRSGRPWLRLVALHCPPGSVCAWCGEPIEFGLRPRHPLGPSLDHIVALADGGHPTAPWNLQPMHLGCNARKENARRRAARKNAREPQPRPASRLRPEPRPESGRVF
ncbi:HNH endonuclease [Sinomonas sp. JGH33]|uniref:HNH endonuclease n=1 Tax=Sinomonas terricola TaxID=3110330 RepID=A0ABU5T4P5_9MICC|nr:HNH endonuclease [Sinomonas sp. JGH33]MEA5454484.1 HNH endonuclease [Sinomonas sp. JGH33]